MKKILFLMTSIMLLLVGCGKANEVKEKENAQNQEKEEVTLKVASLIPPMTEILELVKPKLAEEGINRKWLY